MGEQLHDAQTTEVSLPTPPDSEEDAEAPPIDHIRGENKRYCYNCGTHLPHETTNFCPSCGMAQDPRVQVPTGPPPRTPETARVHTSYAPGVPPPPQSLYQQHGPGVWSGDKNCQGTLSAVIGVSSKVSTVFRFWCNACKVMADKSGDQSQKNNHVYLFPFISSGKLANC